MQRPGRRERKRAQWCSSTLNLRERQPSEQAGVRTPRLRLARKRQGTLATEPPELQAAEEAGGGDSSSELCFGLSPGKIERLGLEPGATIRHKRCSRSHHRVQSHLTCCASADAERLTSAVYLAAFCWMRLLGRAARFPGRYRALGSLTNSHIGRS